MGVEARRNKAPELVENDRNGSEHSQNQGQLQRCEEGRGNICCDHGLANGQQGTDGLRQPQVKFVGKRINGSEADQHRKNHLQ